MDPAEETSSPSENSPATNVEPPPVAAEQAPAPESSAADSTAPAEGPGDDRHDRGRRRGRGGNRGDRRPEMKAQGNVDNPEPPKPAAIHASGRRLRRLIDEDLGDELEQAMAGVSLESAASAFESVPAAKPAAQPS